MTNEKTKNKEENKENRSADAAPETRETESSCGCCAGAGEKKK